MAGRKKMDETKKRKSVTIMLTDAEIAEIEKQGEGHTFSKKVMSILKKGMTKMVDLDKIKEEVENEGYSKLSVMHIESVKEVLDTINADSELVAKLSPDTDYIIIKKY